MRRRRELHRRAGLARDHSAGRGVPRRKVELPVGVDVAGGDVAQVERRRAAAPDVAHAAEDVGGGRALALALRGRVGEAGGHEGAGQVGLLARPQRLVVARGTASADRPVEAACARVVDHPHLRLPVHFDRDRHGVGRVAVDVVGRAVERVDHPADAARALARGALLTEQAVVRPRGQDALHDQPLGLAVDLAHGIGGGGLGLDVQHAAAPVLVDLSGGEREARREVQQLEEVWGCFDHGFAPACVECPRTVANAPARHQQPGCPGA